MAPSLEVLLAMERGEKPVPSVVPDIRALPIVRESPLPLPSPPDPLPDEVVPNAPPDAVSETSIPIEPRIEPPIETPIKLQAKNNWSVENYFIARDWWQKSDLRGSGISIALLGTGAAVMHPDLPNVIGGFVFPDNNAAMVDQDGLGTQAAIIAAGAGRTIFGVAPEANLLIGKTAENDPSITVEGMLAGLAWALESGADIIVMLADFPSLSNTQNQAFQQRLDKAMAQGILLVAPVGNSDNKTPVSNFPASLNGVLSVGAHDRYGQRCRFSACSTDLDILVAGQDLLTSTVDGQLVNNLNTTKIAAAFAAGFLALFLQKLRSQNKRPASDAVFNLIRETGLSRNPSNKGNDTEYGYGILNPIEVLNRLEQSK